MLNVLGLSSWFYALNITSAIEASAISFTTPLVAIIIACMFTKEKMSIISVTSLLLAMFGALMLVSPDHININSGNLLALFSALIWAIHDVICKIQARKEHLFSQIIITFSLVSVLSLPLNLFSDFLPTISDIYVIALMGFLFVLNLYCLTKSYAATDLVVVMPLSFVRLVFTAILSYIFIGEVIAQESFNACLIIILGSMLSIIPNIYQYITKKV